MKAMGVDKVSVRLIDKYDNRRAGASLGAQLSPYANGQKVIVIPINLKK